MFLHTEDMTSPSLLREPKVGRQHFRWVANIFRSMKIDLQLSKLVNGDRLSYVVNIRSITHANFMDSEHRI